MGVYKNRKAPFDLRTIDNVQYEQIKNLELNTQPGCVWIYLLFVVHHEAVLSFILGF